MQFAWQFCNIICTNVSSLTSEHLLVSTEGEVKIADFSLSIRDGTITRGSLMGHAGRDGHMNFRWTAPEVLRHGLMSKHADIWWVGGMQLVCSMTQNCLFVHFKKLT